MNFAELNLTDLIGAVLGLVFTLSIFSYILGDNMLFRIASSIFIGAAAGFAVILSIYNVLIPQVIVPLLEGDSSNMILVFIPLLLSLLLVFKLSPKLSGLGNPSMAFLVGVGVAAVIGGAITGTIFPQSLATIHLFGKSSEGSSGLGIFRFIESSIILMGTITTLVYFHFSARQKPGQYPRRWEPIEWLSWIGQCFIAVTLGVLYAGVLLSALAALVERVSFLWKLVESMYMIGF